MKKTFLDFNIAIQKALENATVTKFTEVVSIDEALGRVLAKDIACVKNLPSFNNSAMDGFAIKASDAGKSLKVKKVIFAGQSVDACLQEGECYKIMTGAKVPSDVDTIIPIEDVVSFEENIVTIKEEVKKGSSLRLKGEEKALGELLFEKADVITSSKVAVLASQGIVKVEVYKKLSIAVVSTGNELKEPWEEAKEDEIYNCNSYALISFLQEKGFKAVYSGLVPDNLEESIEFVKDLSTYDVVITTGGISMGDADFIGKAFLENELETIFHGVNIKPGRPIMMGKMKNTFVMCLPGNPLTALVNMHLFAIPVLNKIQGSSLIYHDVTIAKNQEEFKTKAGRVNVVLGTCEKGEYKVTKKNKYGSGMITVLDESNCILVTDESTVLQSVGDSVKVIKFNCSYLKEQTNIFN
ncbi:molybdopterin molybdenumtransferase MoeA [Arcobacter sp. CECT 8983]|uniref:molybdopterin molybdotransferase MoeA n=1 Tax=Arcobacter sp. CECT 8983 TaxID=2044508 RepID=UPI00100C0338|nr:molybdopterin molybdotransferase MoeA [Arcobacter sp. CECT 8983]RXJ90781.1 molybdopterin molybdenumtransferase MoeA [Arcobacter sp. CECT 8983]